MRKGGLQRARGLATVGLLLALAPGWAEPVRDLYQAQVPVADRGAQELDRAAGAALAEVLVKVSGSLEVLELPALSEAQRVARSRVQQYSYLLDPRDPGALVARVEFDARMVAKLLMEAQAPLWTANRPTVLVWLVIESEQGRQFVNAENTPELAAELVAEFSRRGVPLRLPLYDLRDATMITPDQAWSLAAPILERASSRYDVDEILAGRISQNAAGEWAGEWVHQSGATRVQRAERRDTAPLLLQAGVALVAEDLAAQYAVAASDGPAADLSMVVAGVHSYADYAAVISWLESLELVEHANVETIEHDRIKLRLTAHSDAGKLASIIELNPRLAPVASIDPAERLHYQWQN